MKKNIDYVSVIKNAMIEHIESGEVWCDYDDSDLLKTQIERAVGELVEKIENDEDAEDAEDLFDYYVDAKEKMQEEHKEYAKEIIKMGKYFDEGADIFYAKTSEIIDNFLEEQRKMTGYKYENYDYKEDDDKYELD